MPNTNYYHMTHLSYLFSEHIKKVRSLVILLAFVAVAGGFCKNIAIILPFLSN